MPVLDSLSLHQHLLFLISVESDAHVGTVLLEDVEQYLLHLWLDRYLGVLRLVEAAHGIGGTHVEMLGIAMGDGVVDALESPSHTYLFGDEMVRAGGGVHL